MALDIFEKYYRMFAWVTLKQTLQDKEQNYKVYKFFIVQYTQIPIGLLSVPKHNIIQE